MSKYMVFQGENYYPAGGWDDLIGFASSIEEAKSLIPNQIGDEWWAHIVALEDPPRLIAMRVGQIRNPWKHIKAGWYHEGEPAFIALQSERRYEFSNFDDEQ